MTADLKMATVQFDSPLLINRDDDLLQEVQRLRREVAMAEQQYGGLQEDMGEDEGYTRKFNKKSA